MPRVVEFDFTGVTPAQGGGGSDYIPQGRYVLTVTKADLPVVNANGNTVTALSFEVAGGDYKGKRLTDRFVRTAASRFGEQRLMAFFNALTGKETPSQSGIKVDFDNLIGKSVQADVRDNTIPANDRYPERLASQIDAYYPLQTAAAAPRNGAVPAADIPPAAPIAAAPVAAPAPVPVAAATVPAQAVAAEVDDLFS